MRAEGSARKGKWEPQRIRFRVPDEYKTEEKTGRKRHGSRARVVLPDRKRKTSKSGVEAGRRLILKISWKRIKGEEWLQKKNKRVQNWNTTVGKEKITTDSTLQKIRG